jgi:hypothetical protein
MRLARKYDARLEGEDDATPAQPWDAWDASTWETWERTLRPGRTVRVCLPDGTETAGTFRRRYPRNILVSVGEGTVLVPRFGNTARARNNRIHPSL